MSRRSFGHLRIIRSRSSLRFTEKRKLSFRTSANMKNTGDAGAHQPAGRGGQTAPRCGILRTDQQTSGRQPILIHYGVLFAEDAERDIESPCTEPEGFPNPYTSLAAIRGVLPHRRALCARRPCPYLEADRLLRAGKLYDPAPRHDPAVPWPIPA